jgi:GNAT superfamily N-acetyltransferase
MLRTFKFGEDIYDVPENEVSVFQREMPDAVEIKEYQIDDDVYDVPVNETPQFLASMPEAKPIEKIGQSGPTLDPLPMDDPGASSREMASDVQPPSEQVPEGDPAALPKFEPPKVDQPEATKVPSPPPSTPAETSVSNLFDDERNKAIIDEIAGTGSTQSAYEKWMYPGRQSAVPEGYAVEASPESEREVGYLNSEIDRNAVVNAALELPGEFAKIAEKFGKRVFEGYEHFLGSLATATEMLVPTEKLQDFTKQYRAYNNVDYASAAERENENIVEKAVYGFAEMLPGLAVGFIPGAGQLAWAMEGAGQLYGGMIDEGVNRYAAIPLAMGGGYVYSMLERAKFLDMVPGARKVVQGALKSGLAKATKRTLIKRLGKTGFQKLAKAGKNNLVRMTARIAKEDAEEIAQEITITGFDNIGREITDQLAGTKLMEETDFAEQLNQYLQVAKESVGPLMVATLAGHGASRGIYGKSGVTEKKVENVEPERPAIKQPGEPTENIQVENEAQTVEKAVDEIAAAKGIDLDEATIDQIDDLYDEARKQTGGGQTDIEVENETEAIDQIVEGLAVERDLDPQEMSTEDLKGLYDEAEKIHSEWQVKDRSMRLDETKNVVDEVTANWKNRDKVHVVEDENQLPRYVKESKRAQTGGEFLDVEGVYLGDGEIYLVSEGVKGDTAEARRRRITEVLAHEGFGHFGIRQVAGKNFDDTLDRVYESTRDDIAEWLPTSGYSYDLESEKGRRDAAEEFFANLSERGELYEKFVSTTEGKGKLKRVIDSVREFLHEMFPNLQRKFTDGEILDLLGRSRSTVDKSATAEQDLSGESVTALRKMAKTQGIALKDADGKYRKRDDLAAELSKFSFAGQKAQTADKSALDRAKTLIEKGYKPNAVRQLTGWFKGKYDDKWRFEIDDSKMEINEEDFETYNDRMIEQDGVRRKMSFREADVSLRDILNHPKLFRAYPQLADARVTMMIHENATPRGRYQGEQVEGNDPYWMDIDIHARDIGEAKSILLHEVQHAIQRIEGFARGSSPAEVEQMRSQISDELKKLRRENPAVENYFKKQDEILKNETKETFADALLKHEDNAPKELKQFWKEKNKLGESNLETYRRFAGEIESRDVQQRARHGVTKKDRNFNAAVLALLSADEIEKTKEWDEEQKIWDDEERNNAPAHKRYFELIDEIESLGFDPNSKWEMQALREEKPREVGANAPYESEDIPREKALVRFSVRQRKRKTSEIADHLADVVNHTSLGKVQRIKYNGKPALEQAKHGSVEAGHEIVKRTIKKKVIDQLRKMIDPNKPLYVVPVNNSEDSESLNMLPKAYATELAKQLNGKRDDAIIKVEDAGLSYAEQKKRAKAEINFEGYDLPDNPQVIIVDDNFTSGQTTYSLYEYLADNGADVKAISSLGISRYGKSLKPTPENIQKLKSKSGLTSAEMRAIMGNDENYLTNAEIRAYLFNGKAGKEGFVERFGTSKNESGSGKKTRQVFQGSPDHPQLDQPKFSVALNSKNLVAVHNLSEENIEHALKMGGLPVPSAAVIRTDKKFDNFGEISLIADKALIDPRGGGKAKTFNADVYSPRYPSVHYQIDRNAFDAFPNDLPEGLRFPSMDRLESDGLRAFDYEDGAKYQFLKEKGKAPRITYKKNKFKPTKGLRKFIRKDREKYIDTPEFKTAANEYYEEKFSNKPRARELLLEEGDGEFPSHLLRSLANELRNYGKREVDTLALTQRIKKRVNMSKYREWVKNKFSGLIKNERIFDGFTNAGDRKYLPHNLDTVVRVLKRDLQGGESFNYGVGSIRSKAAKQFRSVKEIQENRDQIVSGEEFEKIKEGVDGEFKELAKSMMSYRDMPPGEFQRMEAASDDLMAMAEGDMKYLREMYPDGEPFQKMRDFLNKLRNMPTEYFESKIQRAVDLGEFRGAVVPNTVSKKTVDALKEKGLTVKRYKKGDVEARRKAADELSGKLDVKFSITPAKVESFSKSLAKEFDAEVDLHLKRGDLKLDMIAVPKERRKRGIGTEIIERITKYADKYGLRVVLNTATAADNFGTTSQERLKKFYKRFGFVENKGRRKNYAISENMYRNSVPQTKFSVTPAQDREYLAAVESGDMDKAQKMLDKALAEFEGYRNEEGRFKYRKSVHGVGMRYGNPPESGRSFNTRDNKLEAGISLASAGNLPEVSSFAISAMRDSNAPRVYLRGDILTQLGGDDEFLMSSATPISEKEYNETLNNDKQAIADYVLSNKRSDVAVAAGVSNKKWNVANDKARANILPVTRDDQGNVIPLSERFNERSEDIRFSMQLKSWNEVRKGDKFDSVKRLMPKEGKVPESIDSRGSLNQVAKRVMKFLKENPVITAYDGRKILLKNPDGAKGIFGRAVHLIAPREKKAGRIKAGERLKMDPRKVALVLAIPETLTKAHAVARQRNDILYFKKYENGTMHMVITDKSGNLTEHGKIDGGIKTQYAPERNQSFEGATVLVTRTMPSAPGNAGWNESSTPRGQTESQTGNVPTSQPHASGKTAPVTIILQQNGDSVKFSREEIEKMTAKQVRFLARENGVEFKAKAKYLSKGRIVENLLSKGVGKNLQSEKIRDNIDDYGKAKDNQPQLREGEGWLPGFEPWQEFLPGLEPDAQDKDSGRTRSVRNWSKTLAKTFSDELKARGTTSFIGKEVKSVEDVATISQRVRDYRYETFRIIGVKDGKISEVLSSSQRLPGMVAFDVPELVKHVTRLKDDGQDVYLLHNHPSGKSSPSVHDISLTTSLDKMMPDSISSHVIINHNEYSTIDKNGDVQVIKKDFTAKVPQKEDPYGVLGASVTRPETVADIAKKLQSDPNVYTLIYRAGGNRGVRAVLEVDAKWLETLSKQRLAAYIRLNARRFGGHDAILGGVDKAQILKHQDLFEESIREGFLTDVVATDGYSLMSAEGISREGEYGVRDQRSKFHDRREDYRFSIAGEKENSHRARLRDLERRRREQYPEWAWIRDHFKAIGPQGGQEAEFNHALESLSSAAVRSGKAGLLDRKNGVPADFIVSMINEPIENGGMGKNWDVADLLEYAVGLGKGLPKIERDVQKHDPEWDIFERKMREDVIESTKERALLGESISVEELREFPELADFIEELKETNSLADAMLDVSSAAKGDKARIFKTLREAAYQKAIQDADDETRLREAQKYVIDYARRFMPKAEMSKVLKWLDGRLENNNNLLKALAEIDAVKGKAKMTKSKKGRLRSETKAAIEARVKQLVKKRGLRILENRNVNVEGWEPRTFGEIVRKAFDEGRREQKTIMTDVNTFVEDTITRAFRSLAAKFEGDLPKWRGALEQVADEFEALKEDVANARNSKEKVSLAKQHLELMFGDRYLAIRRSTRHDVFRTMKHLSNQLQEHLGRYYSKAFTRLFNSVNPDKLYNGEGEMNFANQWRALAKEVKAVAELAKEIRDAKGYRAKLRNAKAGPKQIAEVTDRIEDAERRMRMIFENKRYLESKELLNRFSEIKAQSELMQEKVVEDRDIRRGDFATRVREEIDRGIKKIRMRFGRPQKTRGPVKNLLKDASGDMESWALTLGGGEDGSASHALFYENLRKHNSEALNAEADADRALHDMLLKHGFATKKRNGKIKIDYKRFREMIAASKKPLKLVNGKEVFLSQAQIMDLYALTLDDDALKKLVKNGFKSIGAKGLNDLEDIAGWSRPENVAIIDDLINNHLTPEQRGLVEDMVRYVTEQGVEGNKTALKVFGYEKFLSPSHWRAQVDRGDDPRFMGQEELAGISGYSAVTLKNLGMLKDRVQHKHPLLLDNVFDQFFSQVYEMANFTHMTIPTLDALNVLNAPEVKTAMLKKLGTRYAGRMRSVVQRLSGLAKHSDKWNVLDRAAAGLQRNISVGILGWRISSGLTNLIGGSILYANELAKINPKLVADYAARSLPKVFLTSKRNREIRDKLLSNGYLYQRWEIAPARTFAALPQDETEEKSKRIMRKRHRQEVGMRLMAIAEMRNAIMLFKTLATNGYSETKALDMIEKMTRVTQNPSTALEESGLFTAFKESPTWGFFFPFYGHPSVMRNILLKDLLRGNKKRIIADVGALAASSVFTIGLRYLISAISKGWLWEDDEEEKKKQLQWSLQGLLQEVADWAVVAGAGRMASFIYDAIDKYSKSKSVEGFLKQLAFGGDNELSENLLSRIGQDLVYGTALSIEGARKSNQAKIEKGALRLMDAAGMLLGEPTGGLTQGLKLGFGTAGRPLGKGPDELRRAATALIEGRLPLDEDYQEIAKLSLKDRSALRQMAMKSLSATDYKEYRKSVAGERKLYLANRPKRKSRDLRPQVRKGAKTLGISSVDLEKDKFMIAIDEIIKGHKPNMTEFAGMPKWEREHALRTMESKFGWDAAYEYNQKYKNYQKSHKEDDELATTLKKIQRGVKPTPEDALRLNRREKNKLQNEFVRKWGVKAWRELRGKIGHAKSVKRYRRTRYKNRALRDANLPIIE